MIMKSDKNKALDTIKTKSMGRPTKEVDTKVIASLSQIGCTQEEIGAVVGISARTLNRRFADLLIENKNKGKASLRKKMWEKALKGNEKLLIWLSKNELNMKDKIETQSIVEPLPLIIDAKAEDVEEKR
jgi:alkylhydroperoxidase/carboxymuconolactone decarboxylase family protein YurZ